MPLGSQKLFQTKTWCSIPESRPIEIKCHQTCQTLSVPRSPTKLRRPSSAVRKCCTEVRHISYERSDPRQNACEFPIVPRERKRARMTSLRHLTDSLGVHRGTGSAQPCRRRTDSYLHTVTVHLPHHLVYCFGRLLLSAQSPSKPRTEHPRTDQTYPALPTSRAHSHSCQTMESCNRTSPLGNGRSRSPHSSSLQVCQP